MRFIGFTFLMVLFVIYTATAQPVSQVRTAFTSGNATEIGAYFNPEVEICINREQSILSKQDAIAKVRSFFVKHEPTAFSNIHEGASKSNGTGYITGDLMTKDGKFRVFVYFEGEGSSAKIKEIRIDQR